MTTEITPTEITKKFDPFSINSIKTRMITLQNRPDLGLNYHDNANLLSNKQQYAIIVSNMITTHSTIGYFFNIPITCQTWRQIGFGCFIVIPYYQKDPDVINAIDIVKNNLVKWGQEFPGSIIILEMQVSEEQQDRTVQISQVVRLFIAQILKYSMSTEDFATIQNTIYLITTDVDLMPLSTKVFRDLSHDWHLVSPISVNESKGLYVLLSCIGASLGVWNYLMNESDFNNVQHFNSTGIVQVCDQEKQKILEKKLGVAVRWGGN